MQRFAHWGHAVAAVVLLSSVSAAEAACVSPVRASPEAVQSFVGAPNAVLSAHPEGGAGLITALRELVTSDRSTVAAVGGLVASANAAQRSAIGSALAQAAAACSRTDQDALRDIQQLVAGMNNAEVVAAYTAITGDVRTAAVGGAGGGAAAGGGALGGAGTGQGTGGGGNSGNALALPVTLTTTNAAGGINPGSGQSLGTLQRRSVTLSVSGSN